MLQNKYSISGSDDTGANNKMKTRNEEDLVGLGKFHRRDAS